MAGMTEREILKLVKEYIGVQDGNLMHFSYNTLYEFCVEIGVSKNSNSYSGTKKDRFVTILRESDAADQAKIIRGVLQRIKPASQAMKVAAAELSAVADRLEGACPVASISPQITSDIVETAIKDAERLLETRGTTSAVDRLHTVLHGYLKAICDSQQIAYSEGTLMSGLFSLIRANHPAFAATGPREREIDKILRSISGIMDAMNPIRNEASVAHPNKKLLEPPEAALFINVTRTILHYIDTKIADTTITKTRRIAKAQGY